MAQFLRPDSDVAVSTWAGTPTTSGIYQNVDEATASNADFVYSGNNPNGSGCELGLGNPGGTPQSGTCTVRYRDARLNGTTLSSTGTAVSLDVQILDGANVIASSGVHTVTGSWTAGSFTFNTAAVSNWNDLRVKFVATGGGGSPSNRRGGGVSWIEVETPDQAAAPDSLTANSISAAPFLTTPALGQKHALTASGISAAAAITAPDIGQKHALAASGITAQPSTGAPALSTGGTDALEASGASATASIEAPTLGQVHVLFASGPTAQPAVTTPTLAQIHALVANSIIAATSLGQPTPSQTHALQASGINSATKAGNPTIGNPGNGPPAGKGRRNRRMRIRVSRIGL